jgi:hypothetical protein
MLCLSDSDFVVKLAEFDLLEEALGSLGVSRADVRVLPELSHVLKGERILATHTRDAVERASKFVRGIKVLEKIDPQEQILLHSVKATYRNRPIRIDGGEAILYCATKFLKDYVVATGDKASLRALASAANCRHIHSRLTGRVLCVEKLLLMLMDKHGFKLVQQRVAPMCSCDDCVRQAFANGKPDMPELDCRTWLDSFIKELQQETSGLLVH